MSFLGKYEHPRPHPAQRHPYPWVEAEKGDWFLVFSERDARTIRYRLSACMSDATKRYDWRPVFRAQDVSAHVVKVERVA